MTDRQLDLLRDALDRGERLTILDAALHYGIMALSQRIGNLIAEGYPIRKEWVKTNTGKKVKRYSRGSPETQEELGFIERSSHVAP